MKARIYGGGAALLLVLCACSAPPPPKPQPTLSVVTPGGKTITATYPAPEEKGGPITALFGLLGQLVGPTLHYFGL